MAFEKMKTATGHDKLIKHYHYILHVFYYDTADRNRVSGESN